MAIKVDVVSSDAPVSSIYSTNAFRYGILNVRLGSGQWVPQPNLSSLYPVIIDLYGDGSIRQLEIYIQALKHYIDPELRVPKDRQPGQVIVLREDTPPHLADLWFDRDHSLFHVQAIRNPERPVYHIQIADHVVVDVTADNVIAGLWLLDLPPEVGIGCNQPQYIHDATAPKGL